MVQRVSSFLWSSLTLLILSLDGLNGDVGGNWWDVEEVEMECFGELDGTFNVVWPILILVGLDFILFL